MTKSATRVAADGELFKSTGIDDNATSTAVTIDASENVGIGTASPLNALQIGSANPITMNGNYPDIHFNGYYAAPHYRAVTTGYATRMAFNPSNGSLSFKVGSNSTSAGANYNPIERVTLDKDGHLLVGDGITLGNGQSYSAANTLSDYETGTWTPSFGGSTSNPTVNFNVAGGTYVKVGRLVTIGVKTTTVSVSGGSGGLFLNGLPFTRSTDGNYGAVAALTQNFNALPSEPLRGYVASDYVRFKYGNAVDVPTSVLRTSGDSNQIWMSFTYHTDS